MLVLKKKTKKYIAKKKNVFQILCENNFKKKYKSSLGVIQKLRKSIFSNIQLILNQKRILKKKFPNFDQTFLYFFENSKMDDVAT